MQRNNIIAFAVIAVCLVVGYYFLVMPSEEERQKIQEQAEKRLAEAKEKKQKFEDEKAKKALAEKKKQDDMRAEAAKNKPKIKHDVDVKEEKLETITLGGDNFHLTADLVTRGAGVRKLVLNRFEAANWRGRPTGEKMQLIQDDEFSPSYRMYHYLAPKDENPILGLGDHIWKLVKPKDAQSTTKDGESIEVGKDGKTVTKNKDGEVLAEEVTFSAMVPDMDLEIVKTFKLGYKDYHITLLLEMHDRRTDKNAKPIAFRYQLAGAHGLPIEGEWYASIYRNAFMALVEPNGRVWRKLEDSSGISLHKGGDRFPEASRGENRMQFAGVANQFFAAMIVVDNVQPDKADGGVKASDIVSWGRPTQETTEKKGVVIKTNYKEGTIHFSDETRAVDIYHLLPRAQHHLEEDLKVEDNQKIVLSFYVLPNGKRIATWARLGETPRPQFDDITMRVNSEVVNLDPGETVKHQFLLYHGPLKVSLLNQFTGEKEVPAELVERYTTTLNLHTLTDYPNDNWLGKVSSTIYLTDVIVRVTRFMHWLLYHLHHVFGWGLSIVVLTIMVRGAMFPISRRQALFSIKMQELGPDLKKIQEKYPDDPQAKMQATQEFYKKHGINPLGSCWPVLLQMPIFLGLYFAFQESIHFRLAEFLWMENLAAPDMLFSWGDVIPWISDPNNLGGMMYLGPYLNILPMIAVVFMMIQQSQTMPPAVDEQQAAQQKMMKYMTIFFGIMFYKVAAGLCIYFISSSLWGLAERKLLPKKKTVVDTSAGAAAGQASTAIAPPPKWKGKSPKREKEKDKEKDKDPVTAIDKLKALWHDILKAAEKK